MFNSYFFSSLSKTLSLLNKRNLRLSVYSFVCSISIGILELFGLFMIIVMIYIFSKYYNLASEPKIATLLNFFPNTSPQKIANIIIVFLVVLFLIKNSLVVLLTYLQNLFLNKIAVQITEHEYVKALNKEYKFFLNTDSNHIVRDVYVIPYDFVTATLQSYSVVFNELFVLAFILISLLFINFKIIIFLSITIAPIVFVTTKITKNKLKNIGIEKNKVQPLTYKSFYESIHGYVDIVMYGKKDYFVKRVIDYLKHFYHQILLLKVLQTIPTKIVEFIAILSLSLLFFYTVYFMDGNFISLLVLFSTAAYKVLPSTNKIISANMVINNSTYIFDHLLPPEDKIKTIEKFHYSNVMSFENYLSISNLSFSYESNSDEKVLKDINLLIPIGTKIGFVGESGSGKTTLSKIILGLLEPTKGEIRVDGKLINRENVSEYIKHISYVRQDYFMLDGTIAENIAFGENKNQIDYDKINEIIKKVKLDELVNSSELGINTNIGEFGAKISGGQKQRIAIARALYFNAKIIVLDEATSALDDKTEEDVMNTLYNYDFQKITLIMIAHRISTLRKCDLILEMKDGEIINRFTYKELISKKDNEQKQF